jgi:hypothetical protein
LPKAPITTGEGGAGKPKADYDAGKLRWRIERDYQELKQEVGMDILKDGDGAASTITPPFALRPTDS